jgi:hypothetical protein
MPPAAILPRFKARRRTLTVIEDGSIALNARLGKK